MAARGDTQRGPKIGDSASLWNFTPAPGWTKEQASVLKLCLMKLGVGRWVQIQETGLLPGKVIQQLNGQTQRLLGQQSLAAYTGLRVDVDRVRADNEARADAPRKGGLIINVGAKYTKEERDEMQEAAVIKYGLTPEQIKETDEAMAALTAAAQAAAAADAADAAAGRDEAAAAASAAAPALMSCDAAALGREAREALAARLHTKYSALAALLAQHQAAAAAPAFAPAPPPPSAPAPAPPAAAASNQENRRQPAAAAAPMEVDALQPAAQRQRQQPAAAPAKGGAKRKSGEGGRGRGARARPAAGDGSDGDGDVEMVRAAGAAAAADVAALTGMGFGARQARDALEETGGDMDAAAEWLMLNCV